MKKNILSTISVGIPAYNEGKNIRYLVRDLLKQNLNRILLEQIIVSSDGSTDQTINELKKIKSKKIVVLDNKVRRGQAFRQNQIIRKTDSDVLVLLNADILIKDKFFLKKLTAPILSEKADLTSARVYELPARNFIEKILKISMEFKKYIFENYNNGNNIYTCHGRNRAFSKRLYRKINFKESVGEDAFSYLFCIKNKFQYRFIANTGVYYRLPDNLHDHEKQSLRFYQSQNLFKKEFGIDFVTSQNYLSAGLLLKFTIKYFFINPFVIVYFVLALYLKMKSMTISKINSIWDISVSSKDVRL